MEMSNKRILLSTVIRMLEMILIKLIPRRCNYLYHLVWDHGTIIRIMRLVMNLIMLDMVCCNSPDRLHLATKKSVMILIRFHTDPCSSPSPLHLATKTVNNVLHLQIISHL